MGVDQKIHLRISSDMYAYREYSLYGPRRLKQIARFIQNRSGRDEHRSGYRNLFGNETFVLEFNILTSKPSLVSKICRSGVFEFIAWKYNYNWDRIIQDIVRNRSVLNGYCGLFGLETETEIRRLLQRVSNKLSSIFILPGDSSDIKVRKRYNDARLNLYTGADVFGVEGGTVAHSVTDFSETILNPLMRRMFWSSYVPGTGQFSVSVTNLDKLDGGDWDCPICLEGFTSENKGLKFSPCNHGIHFSCLRGFFLSSGNKGVTCPLCREEILNLVSW